MRLAAAFLSAVAVYAAGMAVHGRLPTVGSIRGPRRAAGEADPRAVWLAQAGLRLTPTQFAAGSVAAGAAVFLTVVLATATPAVAVVPAVTAAVLPSVYHARRRAERLREVQAAWPDGLREITTAVAAGMSMPRAMTALASNGPEPLRRAFVRFPGLLRTVGAVGALESIRVELADPTSDRVIEVLILAHERGGPIVTDLLRDLADATTRDLQALEEISTDTLEQKLNARAVFVLPWLALLALTVRPGHFRTFYQSGGGLAVIAIAGLLSLIGMRIVGRLSAEPVEPRVLQEAAHPRLGHEGAP